MNKVAIHQPNFIPWGGYFEKAFVAEIFIFLDDVEYSHQGYTNRCLVNSKKKKWITVPVINKKNQLIKDVKIFDRKRTMKKIISRIKQNYSDIYDIIAEPLSMDTEYLADINMAVIMAIFEYSNIEPRILISSEMNCKGIKSDKLINLIKEVDGSCYLTGKGGQSYLNVPKFHSNGIHVQATDYSKTNDPESVLLWLS